MDETCMCKSMLTCHANLKQKKSKLKSLFISKHVAWYFE